MLIRVVTKIQNKEGVARVGILFEYRKEKEFTSFQTLLKKYYLPITKTFITKGLGSRVIVINEIISEEFK